MFDPLRENALFQIRITESLISRFEDLLSTSDDEQRGPIKIYGVASCVTRLYAIFEHFFETILSDYLDAIPELIPYNDLSEGLKCEYRIGISYILGRLDNERYRHLTHTNVILWYHQAISNESAYRFITEALTRHNENLRLNIVDNLSTRISLRGLLSWLSRSDAICALYEERDFVVKQLDSELSRFVQLRNDAAHGTLEDLEGRDNLKRYCDLVSALVAAICQFFSKNLLEIRVSSKKSKKIGVVTDVYVRSHAFIISLELGSALVRGSVIHLLGHNYCWNEKILSLQIMGEDVEHIFAHSGTLEVGVKCANLPKRGAEVFSSD